MKVIALVTIIVLCLGYSILAQDNPLGLSNLQWMELSRISDLQRQARETVQKQIEARMEIKRRGMKLNTLYTETAELFVVLQDEQLTQYKQKVEGVVDVKQDVIVSKLTEELRNKVNELWKLNHVK